MAKLTIALGSFQHDKDQAIIEKLLLEHGVDADFFGYTQHTAQPEKGADRAEKQAKDTSSLFPDADFCIGIDRSKSDSYTVTHVSVIQRRDTTRGKGAWIHHPTMSPETDDSYANDVREAVWDAIGQLLDDKSLQHTR